MLKWLFSRRSQPSAPVDERQAQPHVAIPAQSGEVHVTAPGPVGPTAAATVADSGAAVAAGAAFVFGAHVAQHGNSQATDPGATTGAAEDSGGHHDAQSTTGHTSPSHVESPGPHEGGDPADSHHGTGDGHSHSDSPAIADSDDTYVPGVHHAPEQAFGSHAGYGHGTEPSGSSQPGTVDPGHGSPDHGGGSPGW